MFKFILYLLPLIASAKLLSKTKFLMSHDSGTGYLNTFSVIEDWAKTQRGNFTQQLDCGARAFDVRVITIQDQAMMHHGIVKIKTPLDPLLLLYEISSLYKFL